MSDERFIFANCQHGMESTARDQILRHHPELRLAFSRPGFMTFKVVDAAWPDRFQLRSPLVRTMGWSVDSIRDASTPARIEWAARQIENAMAASDSERFTVHVWSRDLRRPGERGFEPGPDERIAGVVEGLRNALANSADKLVFNQNAKANQRVYDLILVDEDHWFWGWHDASTIPGRWVGGVPKISSETKPISRAYYKLTEALLWSGIRINPGDLCVEIGSSPGGACQRLVELGARVIAVDPADLAPEIAENPAVQHLRKRGHELRKQEVIEARWLMADVNIQPAAMLNTILGLIDRGHLGHVRGMLLTLKLPDSSKPRKQPKKEAGISANDKSGREPIPELEELARPFRERGYRLAKLRQLAFNRNELCLLIARDRFAIRSSRKRSKDTSNKTKKRPNSRSRTKAVKTKNPNPGNSQ